MLTLSQKPEDGRQEANTCVKNESYESHRNPDLTVYECVCMCVCVCVCVCVDETVSESSAANEDLKIQSQALAREDLAVPF